MVKNDDPKNKIIFGSIKSNTSIISATMLLNSVMFSIFVSPTTSVGISIFTKLEKIVSFFLIEKGIKYKSFSL